MKHCHRIALVTLFAAHPVAAQLSPVQIGIEGGASIATLTGSGAQGLHSRTSGTFGAVLVLQSGLSPIGFETGIAYVPKGAINEVPGAKITFADNYVEIPLLLRVNLPLPAAPIRPIFDIGASVGIPSGCRYTGVTRGTTFVNDCNAASQGGAAFSLKTDLGFTAGVGIDIPLRGAMILAPTVRYTHGISDLSTKPSALDAINSAFQVGVALRWHL